MADGGDLLNDSFLPFGVEGLVRGPGRVDVDRERSVLNAADVLLDRTHFPRHRQATIKEPRRDRRAQDSPEA